MTPTVLLYNFSGDRAAAVQKLCMTQRLRFRHVCPAQFSLPLEDLLRLPAQPPHGSETPAFLDEMLVFAGLAPGQLNNFLHAWRKAKLPPVPLKAIVTKTNAGWDSLQLKRELSLEHEAMQAGGRAHTEG